MWFVLTVSFAQASSNNNNNPIYVRRTRALAGRLTVLRCMERGVAALLERCQDGLRRRNEREWVLWWYTVRRDVDDADAAAAVDAVDAGVGSGVAAVGLASM